MRFPSPGVLEGLLSTSALWRPPSAAAQPRVLPAAEAGECSAADSWGVFGSSSISGLLGIRAALALGMTLLPPFKHLHSRAVSPGVNAVLSTLWFPEGGLGWA